MRLRRLPLVTLVVALLTASTNPGAASRAVDAEQSSITIYVSKTGLFSAFADNHVIRAPIAGGEIGDGPSPSLTMMVRAADLVVTDPDLAPSKRAEVQARMLGADVLDVQRFPNIEFASSSIDGADGDRPVIDGRLTIHGHTRPVKVSAMRQSDHYRGEFAIKQRDFGIEPISIAGGAVKVKDALRITFDIVVR